MIDEIVLRKIQGNGIRTACNARSFSLTSFSKDNVSSIADQGQKNKGEYGYLSIC